MNLTDWIGATGVGMILIAYFCNTFKWINGNGALFFVLNTIGAALACYASYLIDYWPFIILEGIWTLVSFVGLLKATR